MTVFQRSFFGSPHWYWFGDLGLLFLRLGMGTMFIIHGQYILSNGPERWQTVGSVMLEFGISEELALWGFIAGIAQSLAGLLLIIGLFTRGACFILVVIMLGAVIFHSSRADSFLLTSHAIEDMVVFLALMLTGPGLYSLDEKISLSQSDQFLDGEKQRMMQSRSPVNVLKKSSD